MARIWVGVVVFGAVALGAWTLLREVPAPASASAPEPASVAAEATPQRAAFVRPRSTSGAAPNDSTVDAKTTALATAREALASGRIADGLQALKLLSETNPADTELLLEAALAIADLDVDRDLGTDWLRRAAEAAPNDSLVLAKLVDRLRSEGLTDEAAAAATRALGSCSGCGDAHLALADVAAERGDLDTALAEAAQAIDDPATKSAALRKQLSLARKAERPAVVAETMTRIVEVSELAVTEARAGGAETHLLDQALAEDRRQLAAARAALEP